MSDSVREVLADYAHETWSGWMKYMFGKGSQNNDGSVLLPWSVVERWSRQMNTRYQDLPESEKESDRKEADRILIITGEHKT